MGAPQLAHQLPYRQPLLSKHGVIRLQSSTLLFLASIASLCFTLALLCSLFGADEDEPYFKSILNELSNSSPGIILLGENIDVDIDEPSITIRWSIIGCGDGYVLEGTSGVHESTSCGLPSIPLQIYVDNEAQPVTTYEPSELPLILETGQRRNIQNLVQFDSDHVLDVHEAILYPFDTYFLSSTLRAVGAENETVPISKISTIDMTSTYAVANVDYSSSVSLGNGLPVPARDFDLQVARPGVTRTYTLSLFVVNWTLTHVLIGHAIVAWRVNEARPISKLLVSAFAILLAQPQLRDIMPDSPGYDGVLIDCVGFFPQMIFSGSAVLCLLLLLLLRELQLTESAMLEEKAGVKADLDPVTAVSVLEKHPSLPHDKALTVRKRRRTLSGHFISYVYGRPGPSKATFHHAKRSRDKTDCFIQPSTSVVSAVTDWGETSIRPLTQAGNRDQ